MQDKPEDQIILACDDEGNFIEYIPRLEGHTDEGKRHIGLTILLFNQDKKLLLQRRKHQVFDDVWCFTADTHILHKADDSDETIQEAVNRCLNVEYGIEEVVHIKNLGGYLYAAKDKDYCENEYCLMLVGEYDGEFKLNPQAGYEYKWVSKDELLNDFASNPEKFAPWVQGGLNILNKSLFKTI